MNKTNGLKFGFRKRINRVKVKAYEAPAQLAMYAAGLVREHDSMASEGIKDSLKQRGVRLTRQREILLDLIDKSGQHLDAERLYQMAKERDPKLNRVTVYRTLKMLKEGGLVDELDLMHIGGDQHYYETRMKQEHAHIICLRCGKVEEFFGEPLQKLRKQVEAHFGFQVILARTEVGGYCSHCQVLRAHELKEAETRANEAEHRNRAHRGS
jgi:Fur family ferric uptake transcriptional regulator